MSERLRIKRVNDPAGGAMWVLFEEGQFSRPMALLMDFELTQLRDQIREQEPPKPKSKGSV